MANALQKYKAGINRRAKEDRRDSAMRMERAAHRGGMIIGLIVAPWLTMGRMLGPIPVGGAIGTGALLVDVIAYPEGALWSMLTGITEGLGAADLVGAVAAARSGP
jgi:hypothetical protein